jgi:hypothetical protein
MHQFSSGKHFAHLRNLMISLAIVPLVDTHGVYPVQRFRQFCQCLHVVTLT